MAPKNKILIGTLTIVVISFVGCWIWQNSSGQLLKKVSISTDKTEYARGETIRIMVKNDLGQPLFYEPDYCDPSAFEIEQLKENRWERVTKIDCIMPESPSTPPKGKSFFSLLFHFFISPFEPRKIESNDELIQEWRPMKRAGFINNTEFMDPGTYRISFSFSFNQYTYNKLSFGSLLMKEKVLYSNEFVIREKERQENGEIIDLNLIIYTDNRVIEEKPIKITLGEPTPASVLKELKGDYVLIVGTNPYHIETILWSQSFPIDFDYTGPAKEVMEGIDYSKIKDGKVSLRLKIPYEPKMKSLELWYQFGWEGKYPSRLFFKTLAY